MDPAFGSGSGTSTDVIFKKLTSTDDIWEVRATIGNNTFRLLGFFEGPKLIVSTSGFAKKTNKVPKQEIETAEER
jgi:phage-related protein